VRALVTGARGMLGYALADSRPDDVTLIGTDLPELDVTDAARLASCLAAEEPDAVINAAAYTNVDGCETHEEEALAVNGTGARLLAEACAGAGVPLLHVSTDYVFDGRIEAPGAYTEEDATNPLSAYGRTKLAGEEGVRAATDAHWIVRTQWLYGMGGPNFVETMLRLAGERDRLTIVDDQVGSPTSTHDLAPALWAFLEKRPAHGTYHAANAGSCSWFDFAREIFRRAHVDVVTEPMDSSRLDRPAPRPARSVLDTSKLRAALGAGLPPWEEGLARYLERRATLEAKT